MSSLVKYIFLIAFCSSCNSEKEEAVVEIIDHKLNCKNFSDNFSGKIASFWKKDLADVSRHSIVSDPLNADNQVLRIELKLEDYANGGRRSELLMSPKDSFGYKTTYSFKFLLPDSFFQKDEAVSRYIIHQWHDQTFSGFNWKTNPATQPPIHLSIEHESEGNYYLFFNSGIKIGSLNEVYSKKWSEKLKPNKWYTFSCEVLWSLYGAEGYASPKLDGKYFVNWISSKDSTAVHWISRRNMYNINPNYYKFGLYRAGLEKHDRTIYFDDFMFESYREKYNP